MESCTVFVFCEDYSLDYIGCTWIGIKDLKRKDSVMISKRVMRQLGCYNSKGNFAVQVCLIIGFFWYLNEFLTAEESSQESNVWGLEEWQNKSCDYEESNDVIEDIPQYMFDFVDSLVAADDFKLDETCTEEKINFVYIKTHKTASDTLSSVFRQFALRRNLSVVLPLRQKFLLGYPLNLRSFMYRPARHEWGFNIMLDHVIFNHSFMSSIMPSNTIYFTSLRQPFGRLRSALAYHDFDRCGHMPEGVEITEEFMGNMLHYEDTFRSLDNNMEAGIHFCPCMRNGISVTKNQMSFDMGFPTGYHFEYQDQQKNYTFIKEWLMHIQDKMDLVMIVEYFDESMVFLKRFMCWGFSAILYRTVNRSSKSKVINVTQEQIDAFNKWSNVDTLLFRMVNHTFFKRIGALGEDFKQEVVEFKSQVQRVMQYCYNRHNLPPDQKDELVIPPTKWDQGYKINGTDCALFLDASQLRNKVKEAYDDLRGDPLPWYDFNEGAFC